MTNEQRARNLLMEIWDAPDRETGVALIAAAFADVEREALERAAKWHDNLAAQSRKEARQKDEEGWFQKGKDARENARWHEHFAFAIRALSPEPAASVTHSASCNISEKLSDVCSCGADPAAPDPTKPESQAPMEAAPLPCPFCGGPAMIAEYGDGQHIVFCASCDCHPSPEETASDAITAWNRRSGTADPTKALARLFTSGIKSGNAGYLFVRQLARDHGLLDGDPLWQEPPPLTESGRAALRLAENGG